VKRASRKRKQQGMTLIEIIIVAVIMTLAASGLSLSLGALSRSNLKSAAGKIAAAFRYAYNRAATNGTTVRVHFTIPGVTFSIEEAHGGVLLATRKEKEEKKALNAQGKVVDAIDPWESAQARIAHPDKPTVGASPFSALTDSEGNDLKRYSNISLGRGVQFVKLIVPHEPEPRTSGDAAVHFFAGGRTEHALVEVGDGREGVYTVEVRALTGRVKIYPEAHESRGLIMDPDEDKDSEVKE
jgi:type II secretion system protein H